MNANSSAISGEGSCTTQASMPPGLITRSIWVACGGGSRERRERGGEKRRAGESSSAAAMASLLTCVSLPAARYP